MKIVKAIQLLIREARMNRVYAGKGIAVMRGPRGTLVARLEAEGGGGGGGTGYDGPFALSFDSTKQKVVVEAGFAWLNGMFVTVAKTELTPETNYICVNAELSDLGVWSTPVIQFATPSATNYPIGRCDATEIPPPEPEEGEEPDPPTYKINDLIPFMQPVAIIFGTGDCMEELIVPES